MRCVDVFNDNANDNEIRDGDGNGDADGDRQLYADISVTQLNGADAKVKDVAKLLVIKRSAEGLTFQFATRRGQDDLRHGWEDRTGQNRTEQGRMEDVMEENNIQDMQICKSTLFLSLFLVLFFPLSFALSHELR